MATIEYEIFDGGWEVRRIGRPNHRGRANFTAWIWRDGALMVLDGLMEIGLRHEQLTLDLGSVR